MLIERIAKVVAMGAIGLVLGMLGIYVVAAIALGVPLSQSDAALAERIAAWDAAASGAAAARFVYALWPLFLSLLGIGFVWLIWRLRRA